jgi:hypothetical protein
LCNFLRRDSKNTEYLHHYLDDYLRHFRCRWHLSVDFETSEKAFDALEDVNEGVMACANLLGRLRNTGVIKDRASAWIANALKARYQHQQISPSQARISEKYILEFISQSRSYSEAYQTNTLLQSCREGIEDVHGGVQPLCPEAIAAP